MSHGALLKQRITEAIEAGFYAAKGDLRPRESPIAKAEDKPAPMPRAEPEKDPQTSAPAAKGTPDPKSYVDSLAARRAGAVGESVHQALDARFKEKK